ncbi:MAG: flippase [Arenicellales bacterium]
MKAILLKLLPATIQGRIQHSQDLRDIFTNTGWLFADKIVRMGIGVFVGIWVARYLGPEMFGLLNYAMAFVALFGVVASLGFSGLVVRELVSQPENTNTILGSAFLLQFLSGILAYILVVVTVILLQPENDLLRLIVMVLGLTLVFKASEIIKYWFESQVMSKYTIWVETGAFLLMSAVQVLLILYQAPIMGFVWVTVASSLSVFIGLFAVYFWRAGGSCTWKFNFQRSKALLRDSWPLLFTGMAIIVYMRIDQIMLGQMLGNSAVGVYSAAVRISEVWYFIPMAIATSVFPSVIKQKVESESKYIASFQKLFNMMVTLGIAVAILVSFFSDWIVTFLFGSEYADAGPVLVVLIWSGVFVSLGIVSSMWLVNENLQKLFLYRSMAGVVVNIILNLSLIPLIGVTGAAIGTLMSHFVAAYMFDLFNKKTRAIFKMKSRAFYSYFPVKGREG